MISKGSMLRRMRLNLGGILVLALVMAVILSSRPTQANVEPHASALNAETLSSQALHAVGDLVEPAASDYPPVEGVTIDNNTLAVLIAAQNAALTSPQYLIGLPIIQR